MGFISSQWNIIFQFAPCSDFKKNENWDIIFVFETCLVMIWSILDPDNKLPHTMAVT